MILYTLRCEKNHHFDEWFDNMADYDAKAADGGLTCPECGSTDVSKAIMAPSLGASTKNAEPACPVSGCASVAAGTCPAMGGR